jgi:hypothetical protein
MAGPPAIEVKGLKEFRKELKAIGTEWPKAMQKGAKAISDHVAAAAQSRASGMGGVQAKAASMIKAYATPVEASVGFPSGGVAGPAFWGAKRHTGWYAAARYRGSPRQHPVWVGTSWEPGVAGQGPYAINDAVATETPWILEQFERVVDDVTARAFPD